MFEREDDELSQEEYEGGESEEATYVQSKAHPHANTE